MSCSKIIIFCLFVESCLAGSSSNEDSNFENLENLESLMNLLQNFAVDLNSTQIQNLRIIVSNQNLTKFEILGEIEKWAISQSSEIQQEFFELESEVEALRKNMTEYFDQKAANLSSSAKAVYEQYKTIYQNDDLTIRKECQAISNVSKQITDSAVKNELKKVFGRLPKCAGFEKHNRKEHFGQNNFNEIKNGQGRRGFPSNSSSTQGLGRAGRFVRSVPEEKSSENDATVHPDAKYNDWRF